MRQTLACQEHETASSHSETKVDAEEVKPCVAAMCNKVFSHSGCGDCGPWSRVWLVRSDQELIDRHTCCSTAYHEMPRDSSSLLACSYYGKKRRIIGSWRCRSCDRLSFSNREPGLQPHPCTYPIKNSTSSHVSDFLRVVLWCYHLSIESKNCFCFCHCSFMFISQWIC